MLTPFDKIVGIDWSGAKDERRGGKVQVAEYDLATDTERLVGPLRNPDAPWRRDDVLAYVQHEVQDKESTVLVGLDFAFAYPYCDVDAYFPGLQRPPANFHELWDTVERVCALDQNFYGGRFYLPGRSMFSTFHHYRNPRHPNCQLRDRATEELARHQEGLDPSSVFNCVG